MKKQRQKTKVNKPKKQSKAAIYTQQLLNISRFVPLQLNESKACAIEGEDRRLYVYIMLRPDNISVLGRGEILSKIRSLQVVLENLADVQFLCITSTQSYENNKHYYRRLAETAQNPVVARLCLQEIAYLDEINLQMNTSREFMFVLTFPADRMEETRHSILQPCS